MRLMPLIRCTQAVFVGSLEPVRCQISSYHAFLNEVSPWFILGPQAGTGLERLYTMPRDSETVGVRAFSALQPPCFYTDVMRAVAKAEQRAELM